MKKPCLTEKSLAILETCHIDLVRLVLKVAGKHPCAVAWGLRNQLEQNSLFIKGASKFQWPDSDHNSEMIVSPISMAVDVYPTIDGKIPWPQKEDSRFLHAKKMGCFYLFSGIVIGHAEEMKISLKWGGDWDQDGNIMNNRFDDLGHFARKGDHNASYTK